MGCVGKPLLVIGYYTEGTPYEEEAAELIDSLDMFGLDYRIDAVPPLGSWSANARHKSQIIRDRMADEGRAYTLVYLDADARVRRFPDLLSRIDCDFAAHWFRTHELLSSAMVWTNTDAAWELANRWHLLNETQPDNPFGDQENLQQAVEEMGNRLNVYRLPAEYSCIFDLQRQYTSNIKPVIEQMQRSRRHKSEVKGVMPCLA